MHYHVCTQEFFRSSGKKVLSYWKKILTEIATIFCFRGCIQTSTFERSLKRTFRNSFRNINHGPGDKRLSWIKIWVTGRKQRDKTNSLWHYAKILRYLDATLHYIPCYFNIFTSVLEGKWAVELKSPCMTRW